MQTLLRNNVLQRAAGSLALMLLGATAFSLTGQESWFALTGLLASLGGLALLYRVIRIARSQAAGSLRFGQAADAARFGCAFLLLRVLLLLATVAGAGSWLWFAFNDMNEVRMLLGAPRYTDAQVIGREIVRKDAAVGYVHYAYRVSPTLAPEDRFAVPHDQYGRYLTGSSLEVTYAAAAPRAHRIGHLAWEFGVRRALYWLLLLANGAAYLFLPLWLLRVRRKRVARG